VVDLAGWVSRLDAVVELIVSRFARSEPRARVGAYVKGLLAGLERKNGWTLAEHAGAVSPDGMQRLLRSADWDVDGVRYAVRCSVHDGLADTAADPADPGVGVFIADDTGFIKKGRRSAGVQRQYTGTTGRTRRRRGGVDAARERRGLPRRSAARLGDPHRRGRGGGGRRRRPGHAEPPPVKKTHRRRGHREDPVDGTDGQIAEQSVRGAPEVP